MCVCLCKCVTQLNIRYKVKGWRVRVRGWRGRVRGWRGGFVGDI